MYKNQPLAATFAFRLSASAKQRIREIARQENRQPGSVVRVVIEQWLDGLERQPEDGVRLHQYVEKAEATNDHP